MKECGYCRSDRDPAFLINGENDSGTCKVTLYIDMEEKMLVPYVYVFGGAVFETEEPPKKKIAYCPICGRKLL